MSKFKLLTKPVETPVMSEAEIFAATEAYAQLHDAIISGEDASDLEVFENLNAIKDMINSKDPSLGRTINSDPELLAMYREAGSMEGFAEQIVKNLEIAEEGAFADLMWDGIISYLWHRKDKLFKTLEPLIPALIKQVQEADPKKFGQWKMFRQINVFSKYLPDQNQFDKCVKAIKDAITYLSSIEPVKFNQDEFNKKFTGTVYAKTNGKVSSNTAIGAHLLFQDDIRKRGWTEQKHFLDALNAVKELVAEMNKLEEKMKNIKNEKLEGEDKKNAKACASALSMTLDFIGYLGRGITSAARKISGSIWKRLFTLEK